MSHLLQLKNLSLEFGTKTLFKNASLSIGAKERIGLIGINGQGKSTLFQIIAQKITPDATSPAFEYITSGKEELNYFLVPQELPLHDCKTRDYYAYFYPKLLKVLNELKQIDETLQNSFTEDLLHQQSHLYEQFTHLLGHETSQQFESYCKSFGLKNLDNNFLTLSGGEKRKVALALGLSSPASLILWDEPTNHLDLESIEILEDELLSLNKAFILITHDRYLLNKVCSRLLIINESQLKSFEGNYHDYLVYLEQQNHMRTALLDKMENHFRREQEWMRQGIKARGTRSKKRVEEYTNVKGEIARLKQMSKKSLQLGSLETQRKTKQLFEANDLCFSFSDKVILENVSFHIFKGDKLAILGLNGSGKSTLTKILSGELSASAGNLKRADSLIIRHFHQTREDIPQEKTLFEYIGEGRDVVDLSHGGTKHVIGYLESFLFDRDQVYRKISTLSGGEKNRLKLAKFFTQKADFLIMDEPTNDLDLETIQHLENNLKEFTGNLLLISHDRAFIEQVCDKAMVLHKGELEFFEQDVPKAMNYFRTLFLEESLQKDEEGPEEKKELPKAKKIKLSKHQRQRLEKLPECIEKAEEKKAEIERKMGDIDYNQAKAHQELQSLEKDLSDTNQEIDSLTNEWMELEELAANVD